MDSEDKSIAKLEEKGWTGDEHRLQIAAAQEAGLDAKEAELALYVEGFKQKMVLSDREDKSLVFRGRTVLREKEMGKSLQPMLRFLKIARDQVGLRIHDGEFELRISAVAAEQAQPTLDSAKVALQVWIAAAIIGGWAYLWLPVLAGLIWSVSLLIGGWTLRQGLISGRAMLAARISVGLGMLAQEEQLVLPASSSSKHES